VPKSFLRSHADDLAVKASPVLLVFYIVFLPVHLILNGVVKAILYLTGHHVSRREELKSKRDVRFLINLVSKEVGLPQPDMQVIEDIFDFRDQVAHEVMIPFHQLTAASVQQEFSQAARLSHESGQRFLPIYQGRIDNVVGYVDSQDLVFQRGASLREVMKKAAFYPEILRIPDLLLEMNRNALDVVFLADEYGGFSGMITPGQIVGELVHYIPEEGSMEEEITKLGPGRFRMAGRTDLEDVIREAGIPLKRGINSTIGGYICEMLGIIPELGTVFKESGYAFTVTKRDDRHIEELEVVMEG
jgi:CBS domain containing-hemolysin-like protein